MANNISTLSQYFQASVRARQTAGTIIAMRCFEILKNYCYFVGYLCGYYDLLGLEGRGIESRQEAQFSAPFRPAARPTQPSLQWVPSHSRG